MSGIKRYDALGDIDGGYLKSAADGRVVLHTDHLASHAVDEAVEREMFEAGYPSSEFDGALGRDRFERHPERPDDYWYIGTRKAWFGWIACAKSRAKRAGGAE